MRKKLSLLRPLGNSSYCNTNFNNMFVIFFQRSIDLNFLPSVDPETVLQTGIVSQKIRMLVSKVT